MRGCRDLTDYEKQALEKMLPTHRDKLLFLLGMSTGLRIQELLSIRIMDVIQHENVVSRVYIQRKNLKGKTSGRSVLVNPKLHPIILQVVKGKALDSPLFEGYKGQAMTRGSAWRILKQAANALQLPGKIATHSMRKTFAQKVYAATEKDIVKTAYALGHSDLTNTMKYLSFLTTELDDIILRF
jgi:site-specific recombinase XerD